MPTFVCIIDKEVDTSYFYNMAEEEESLSSFNEIKMVHDVPFNFNFIFNEITLKPQFISLDENLNCNFPSPIILPPPEKI